MIDEPKTEDAQAAPDEETPDTSDNSGEGKEDAVEDLSGHPAPDEAESAGESTPAEESSSDEAAGEAPAEEGAAGEGEKSEDGEKNSWMGNHTA